MTRRNNKNMKKLVFLALALTLSTAALTTPTLASRSGSLAAIQQQQPPALPEEASAAYTDYYNEKDEPKKYEKAKAFLEKYASVDEYWKKGPKAFMQRFELKQAYSKCADADKTFFGAGGQNVANLNNMLTVCDAYLAKVPAPDVSVSTRLSLATGFGVLAGFYTDTNRSATYAEKALKLLEPTAPPSKDWPADGWAKFRTENLARLTQYQGLFKLRQASPDNEAAISYLTKAADLKEPGVLKDPNTYLLRAEATTTIYTKLNTAYNNLTGDEKIAQVGKDALAKIYPVVEKMANDYGRVMALTEGKAEFKSIYDDAKSQAEEFTKFLNKNFKVDDLVKHFKADVSVADMPIKAEDSVTPPPTAPKGKGAKATASAPATGATDVKTTEAPAKTPAKAPAKPAPKKRK